MLWKAGVVGSDTANWFADTVLISGIIGREGTKTPNIVVCEFFSPFGIKRIQPTKYRPLVLEVFVFVL